MIKRIKTLLEYFFGIFFILIFISFFTSSIIFSILSLIIAFLLIPKTYNLVSNKINLTNVKRYLIIFFIFFVSLFFYQESNLNKPTSTLKTSSNKTSTIKPTTKPTIVKINKITLTKTSTISPTITQLIKKVYKVNKIIDGDTIEIIINGKKEIIRLIGINTPEIKDPRKPVECFAIEASNKAKSILLGKDIILEADPSQSDRDKYNRLLRYVFLQDGTNFNLLMIKEGYAYEYTYNIPYKYQQQFKEAEAYAKTNKLGLWADNACSNTNNISPIVTISVSVSDNNVNFTCGSKKYCNQMTSCEEAYFYLNNCGLTSLDADKDGVPCESICR